MNESLLDRIGTPIFMTTLCVLFAVFTYSIQSVSPDSFLVFFGGWIISLIGSVAGAAITIAEIKDHYGRK